MTAPVRYPPPANWNDELDERERPFSERSWETDFPLIAEQPQSGGVSRSETARRQRKDRPLPPRIEPTWHSWLVMLLWPIAALCAVGWMVGVGG